MTVEELLRVLTERLDALERRFDATGEGFDAIITRLDRIIEKLDREASEHIVLPADPDDPEDFDVSREGMVRSQRARIVRMTRTRLGISQEEFAERFHVPVDTLRAWEQARAMPPDVIGSGPDRVVLDVYRVADPEGDDD